MRKSVAGFLLSGVIFCAARFADLALFTDLETGLLIEGQVWLRYAVLFAWAALALAVGHYSAGSAAPLTAPKTRSAAFALSAGWSAWASTGCWPGWAAGAGFSPRPGWGCWAAFSLSGTCWPAL